MGVSFHSAVMEDHQRPTGKVLGPSVADKTLVTIESLPNLEYSSSVTMRSYSSEDLEYLAIKLVTKLNPVLTMMETNLKAELRKLIDEIKHLCPESQWQTPIGSMDTRSFHEQGVAVLPLPLPSAVSTTDSQEGEEDPSVVRLRHRNEVPADIVSVVPAACPGSAQEWRTYSSPRTRFDAVVPTVSCRSSNRVHGLVDPLSLSLTQLEAIHADCLLVEGGDSTGAPGNNERASEHYINSPQSSEAIMEEVRSSNRTLAHLRQLDASWKSQEHDMVPTGSIISECDNVERVGSQTRLQQALIYGVLVFWAMIPSGHSLLDRMWYRFGSTFMAFLGIVGAVSCTVLEPRLFYEHMSLLALSVGTAIGLVSIRKVDVLIGPDFDLFRKYAKRNKIIRKVARAASRNMAVVSLAWPTCLVLYVVEEVFWQREDSLRVGNRGLAMSYAFSTIFVSGFFTAELLCLIYLLTALEIMINQFVAKFFMTLEFKSAIRHWNHIHCLLRRTARSVDTAFLAITTSVSIALILHIIRCVELRSQVSTDNFFDIFVDSSPVDFLAMLRTVVLFGYSIYSLAKAAHITELCKRLPSLMSSVAADEDPQERNGVLQFIIMSDAGFQIKGVKLSASFILKVFYVLGAVVFGMMTTLISMLPA